MNRYETVVIIPNYNGINYLKECLDSLFLQSYKDFKIILIDDVSTDNSIDLIEKNYPNVDLIINNKNLGFDKSVNSGIICAIKKYNPDYIALLNNDTKIDEDWLFYLVKSIKSENKIAAVASNMLFYSNPQIINSQGGSCNFIVRGQDVNFGKAIKDVKNIQKYVLASCFGATLINVRYLEDIGLLDERYFSYFEDMDWGWRANLLGYKIIFEEKAVVYHHGSAYWKNYKAKKIYLTKKNSLCALIKNYEAITLLISLPLRILNDVAFSIAQFFNFRIKNNKLEKVEQEIPFQERFKCFLNTYLAILWNLKNIRETLKLRKEVQSKRKVNDQIILKLFDRLLFF